MKKLKIYLDTSIINFLKAKDAPEYMKITKEFFNDYINEYDVYISEIVILEINKTENKNRKNDLFDLISKYNIEVYDSLNNEIENLAKLYIKEDIIPKNKFEDALHIAFSTYYEFDILYHGILNILQI